MPNNRFNSNKSNNYSYKTIKPPSNNGKLFNKANLHELLNELVESNESEDNTVVAENVIDKNESTLLVNSTTANKKIIET